MIDASSHVSQHGKLDMVNLWAHRSQLQVENNGARVSRVRVAYFS